MRTDNKSGWSLNRKNFSPLISKRWETPRITNQASHRVGGRHTCHKPPDFFERSNCDYYFRTGKINESNYLSGEFTDEFLHEQADVGDYVLDDQGFQYRPTQDEMQRLALELEGHSLLFIDCLKGK